MARDGIGVVLDVRRGLPGDLASQLGPAVPGALLVQQVVMGGSQQPRQRVTRDPARERQAVAKTSATTSWASAVRRRAYALIGWWCLVCGPLNCLSSRGLFGAGA